MALQSFSLNEMRTVSAGNYITYVHSELHPNRIMEEHDFFYLLSGSWEIWQDDQKYILNPGDVILLYAGRHHYGLTPCLPGTQTIYLHLSAAPTDQFYCEDPVCEHDTSCEPGADDQIILPTVIHCHNNPRVKELFSDIAFAKASQEHGTTARIRALLTLLLLELFQCTQKKISPYSELLAAIIKLFQNNPTRNYTLQELSDLFFTNSKTINRHFINMYGKTVTRYQLDMKLEAVSQYIIQHPDATLRMAALNYGFYDEFHLSKAFKKKYGVSPEGYRRQFFSNSVPVLSS